MVTTFVPTTAALGAQLMGCAREVGRAVLIDWHRMPAPDQIRFLVFSRRWFERASWGVA